VRHRSTSGAVGNVEGVYPNVSMWGTHIYRGRPY
jgi:hypothetical protein